MSKDQYNKYRSKFYLFGKSLHTYKLEKIISILESYQESEYGNSFLADAQISSFKQVIAERNSDDFKASIRSDGEWI
jgi:hypothetical protein